MISALRHAFPQGSTYDIEAHPDPIRRYIYSLYRDSTAGMHWELGKNATAGSPILPPDGKPARSP